jgi:hypothetical protein
MRRLILTALVFLALADGADVWTSQVTNVQTDFAESNPFARDAQHNLVLKRGIEVKLVTEGRWGRGKGRNELFCPSRRCLPQNPDGRCDCRWAGMAVWD